MLRWTIATMLALGLAMSAWSLGLILGPVLLGGFQAWVLRSHLRRA